MEKTKYELAGRKSNKGEEETKRSQGTIPVNLKQSCIILQPQPSIGAGRLEQLLFFKEIGFVSTSWDDLSSNIEPEDVKL